MKEIVFVMLLGTLPLSATAQGPVISVKNTPGKLRFTTVDKNSIYEKSGFKSGDVVREINGKPADENSRLYDIDEVISKGGTIKVDRKGKPKVLKIKAMEIAPTEPASEDDVAN